MLVSDWDTRQLAVLDLESREIVPIGIEGAGGRFAANGYLVYAVNNELRGLAFDPSTRRVKGCAGGAGAGRRLCAQQRTGVRLLR